MKYFTLKFLGNFEIFQDPFISNKGNHKMAENETELRCLKTPLITEMIDICQSYCLFCVATVN